MIRALRDARIHGRVSWERLPAVTALAPARVPMVTPPYWFLVTSCPPASLFLIYIFFTTVLHFIVFFRGDITSIVIIISLFFSFPLNKLFTYSLGLVFYLRLSSTLHRLCSHPQGPAKVFINSLIHTFFLALSFGVHLSLILVPVSSLLPLLHRSLLPSSLFFFPLAVEISSPHLFPIFSS